MERSLDRSTLLKAAQRGTFGIAARKSGDTWLIDDKSVQFAVWLESRRRNIPPPTIKGELPEPPAWINTDAGRHAWKVNLAWHVNAAGTTEQDVSYRNVLLREADMLYNR